MENFSENASSDVKAFVYPFRHRTTIGRLFFALRTGKTTDDPHGEAIEVLLTEGFDGIEKLRSPESMCPVTRAADRLGPLTVEETL